MCGVFGFLSKGRGRPDIDALKRMALVTEQRGRDAFGLVWAERDGSLHTFKAVGSANEHLDALDRCANAVAILGHCRWATHGDPADNVNNHPHKAGRGWIVHNGVVRNHEDLVRRYRLHPETECDSEVLGLLLEKFGGNLVNRGRLLAGVAEGPLVVLGLWTDPVRVLFVRNGNPLHFSTTNKACYFASLLPCLPGKKPFMLRDRYVCSLTPGEGGLLRRDCYLPEPKVEPYGRLVAVRSYDLDFWRK